MTGPAVLLILTLATALVVALNRWAATTQALIGERANHAATRYDLGAAWSAYDAVRADREADLGIVELRMPPAVDEFRREYLDEWIALTDDEVAESFAAAKDRHPSGRGLRVVGGAR